MRNDLYFIPILARAFDNPNRLPKLTAAFNQIAELACELRYQHGYAQFLHWIDEVGCAIAPVDPPAKAQPPSSAGLQISLCNLLIERDGQVVASLSVGRGPTAHMVHDIIPGHYSLRTSTGWVLLTCTLNASDVSWIGNSDSALPLAADIGDSAPTPTGRFEHRESGITLSLYRGMDRGILEVRYQPPGY